MIDSTMATIYRCMLYGGNETSYAIPKSLVELHDRTWQMVQTLGGRSKLSVDMAACVCLVWQNTTKEGQEFLKHRVEQAAEVATVPMTQPTSSVDWRYVSTNKPVLVEWEGKTVEGIFLREHGENQLRVKVPGMAGKYRVVERENVKLISAS